MRLRAALSAGALAAAAVTTTASAAPPRPAPPKPVCNLVVDAKGDVSNTIAGPVAFQPDDGLDVLGGDIASDAKNITAVVRLAKAPTTTPLYIQRFIVQFKPVGATDPAILSAAIGHFGTTYSYGYRGGTTGGYNYSTTPITGRIDGTTITMTAPLAGYGEFATVGAIKNGVKLGEILVTSTRRAPGHASVPGNNFIADEAPGKLTYTTGTKSCIKVG